MGYSPYHMARKGTLTVRTMEEYDAQNLDYAHKLSPLVEAFLKPHTATGWPAAGPNPENPRDRARQENALLASAEKGRALREIYVSFLADRLRGMMKAMEAGTPWPARS